MFENLTPLSDVLEATGYFDKSVSSGNAMSARLRREIDLRSGRFYLPFDYRPPARTNLGFELQDPSLDIARTNIKDIVIAHTRADAGNVFIVEDRISKKSERGARESEDNILYDGEDVYNLYREKNNNESSLNYMIEVALQNWTVSVLARFDLPAGSREISIAKTPWRIDAIGIGAFDDMALLIWMPA